MRAGNIKCNINTCASRNFKKGISRTGSRAWSLQNFYRHVKEVHFKERSSKHGSKRQKTLDGSFVSIESGDSNIDDDLKEVSSPRSTQGDKGEQNNEETQEVQTSSDQGSSQTSVIASDVAGLPITTESNDHDENNNSGSF